MMVNLLHKNAKKNPLIQKKEKICCMYKYSYYHAVMHYTMMVKARRFSIQLTYLPLLGCCG